MEPFDKKQLQKAEQKYNNNLPAQKSHDTNQYLNSKV